MPKNEKIKDNKVKILIYQGHIHQISIADDIKDKQEYLIEKKVKNSD